MSMHHKQVTVSASKKPVAHKGGKKSMKHMTVTPMANGGATVEHHYMPAGGTEYGMSPKSETHGFTKAKDVGKHVATMLEGMPGGASNAAMAGEPDADDAK